MSSFTTLLTIKLNPSTSKFISDDFFSESKQKLLSPPNGQPIMKSLSFSLCPSFPCPAPPLRHTCPSSWAQHVPNCLWYTLFFLQSISLMLTATALNTSLPPKVSCCDQFCFFFLRQLPFLRSALIWSWIDLIFGPSSSFHCDKFTSTHPDICLIALLRPPSAGGVYSPTPCDVVWWWNMSRCWRNKRFKCIFHQLAWFLNSGSAMSKTMLSTKLSWDQPNLSWPADPWARAQVSA